MQLRYRGLTYQSNPVPVEMIETGLTASFRSLSYPVRRCSNLRFSQKAVKLRYRGVDYIKGQADV